MRRRGLQQTIRRPQNSLGNAIGDDSWQGSGWQSGDYKLRPRAISKRREKDRQHTRTEQTTAETQTENSRPDSDRQSIYSCFDFDFDSLTFHTVITQLIFLFLLNISSLLALTLHSTQQRLTQNMASVNTIGHFEPRGRSMPDSGRASSDDSTPMDSMNHINNGVNGRPKRQIMVSMPIPGAPEAPYFDGDDVSQFLKKFDTVSTRCEYTNEEKLLDIVQYCTRRVQNHIQTFLSYHNGDWDAFKKEMLHEYKDNDLEQIRKSRIYLQGFTGKERQESELKEFCRTFDLISNDLLQEGKIDQITQAELFLKGLPPLTLRRVVDKCRVDATRPEDFNYKQMYREAIGKVDLENTVEAISNMHHPKGYYERTNKRYDESKESVSHFRPQRQLEPILKRDNQTPDKNSNVKENHDRIDELTRQFRDLQVANAELITRLNQRDAQFEEMRQGAYHASAATWTPTFRAGCFGCGESAHVWQKCPEVRQLIDNGEVHWTQLGRLAFDKPCADPEVIPNLPRTYRMPAIHEALNKRRLARNRQPQANIVKYEEPQVLAVNEYESDDGDDGFEVETSAQVLAAQRQSQRLKEQRENREPYSRPATDHFRILKEKEKTENALPEVSKKRTDLQRAMYEQVHKGKVEDQMDTKPPQTEPSMTISATNLPPLKSQQDLQALQENDRDVTRRVEAQIRKTMKNKERLAQAYPSFQSMMNKDMNFTLKDLISYSHDLIDNQPKTNDTKPGVNGPEYHVNLTNYDMPGDIRPAPVRIRPATRRNELAKAPIRIETTAGQKLSVHALLDTGAQICLISARAARATGLPWMKNRDFGRVTGIGGQSSDIIGVMRSVPLEIGNICVPVDCMIVDNIAHSLVLGVPFLRAAEARMEYDMEGSCHVEIRGSRGETVRFVATRDGAPVPRTLNL